MPSNGSIVALSSGEIVSSEAADSVLEMLTPAELIDYQPMGPSEVEQIIRILGDRLESAPVVMSHLHEQFHRAEEDYELAFATAFLQSDGNVTVARMYAKKVTAEKLHTVNLAKEKLRYAEWLQAALTSKLYGYLNINKALTASYFGQTAQ